MLYILVYSDVLVQKLFFGGSFPPYALLSLYFLCLFSNLSGNCGSNCTEHGERRKSVLFSFCFVINSESVFVGCTMCK